MQANTVTQADGMPSEIPASPPALSHEWEREQEKDRAQHDRKDQAEREAVGERAPRENQVRPEAKAKVAKSISVERSDDPSERPARPRSEATFFGDFLFCQKRKLPPAGKALTPQSTEEPTKPQNRKQQTQRSNRKR